MSQSDALHQAREAVRVKDYPRALERYEFFFDHALEERPSLYGVRLSYCLIEWARLGAQYPPALQRLEAKADEALDLLIKTRNPERFHDYVSICESLDRSPMEKFLAFHDADAELARSIVRFVWNQLVDEKRWSVCGAYLPDPPKSYAAALEKFDRAMSVCRADPALGGEEFRQQIEDWYVRDVANLLLVLIHTNRDSEADAIRASMESDMKARERTHLVARALEKT